MKKSDPPPLGWVGAALAEVVVVVWWVEVWAADEVGAGAGAAGEEEGLALHFFEDERFLSATR